MQCIDNATAQRRFRSILSSTFSVKYAPTLSSHEEENIQDRLGLELEDSWMRQRQDQLKRGRIAKRVRICTAHSQLFGSERNWTRKFKVTNSSRCYSLRSRWNIKYFKDCIERQGRMWSISLQSIFLACYGKIFRIYFTDSSANPIT